MPARETSHTVRNVKVRLFTAGDGPPLIFLHGAGGVERWPPFFDLLAARHTVMVPEHPGFGGSDNPAFIRNVGDVAMYYLDFLDDLAGSSGGGKVHLVGQSLGGWIAAELATRDCAHLRSLPRLAPAGIRVIGFPSGDNFIWSPEEAARNLVHDQAYAELAITAAAAASEAEADRALVNRYAASRLAWEPRWFSPALERWLHRIKVPTLVLWGAEDRLLPARYADVWRAEDAERQSRDHPGLRPPHARRESRGSGEENIRFCGRERNVARIERGEIRDPVSTRRRRPRVSLALNPGYEPGKAGQ